MDDRRVDNFRLFVGVSGQLMALAHDIRTGPDATLANRVRAVAVADQAEALALDFPDEPLCAVMSGLADGIVRLCGFLERGEERPARLQVMANTDWLRHMGEILRRLIAEYQSLVDSD